MSLSINHPSFANVDTSPLARQSPVAPKTDVRSEVPTTSSNVQPMALRNEHTKGTQNELMFNAGALTKLFDMFEQFFKSMREMFLGKNMSPAVLPGTNNLNDVKPDNKVDMQVKPSAEKLPVKPSTTDPAIKPEAKKLLVQPDAGKLPVTPGTVGKLVAPDVQNNSAPVLPSMPKPEVTVTNDAKANVQVSVSLNHCHCPDDQGRHRVAPDSGVKPIPQPGVKPEVKPIPQPDVKPEVKPIPQPGIKPEVKPVPQPGVKPEVKPIPQPDTLPIPKSKVTPLPAPNVTPSIDPKVLPDKPEPDLTSSGPVDKRFDSRHWRLNDRPAFRL